MKYVSICRIGTDLNDTCNFRMHAGHEIKFNYYFKACKCSNKSVAKLCFFYLNYSLTHCCAWPAEGRSDLLNKRSWLVIWWRPTDIRRRPSWSWPCATLRRRWCCRFPPVLRREGGRCALIYRWCAATVVWVCSDWLQPVQLSTTDRQWRHRRSCTSGQAVDQRPTAYPSVEG